MKIRMGPKTRISLIQSMRGLDPEGWLKFCRIYQHRLAGLAQRFGFQPDHAEEIAARVVQRLFEEFRDKSTPIDGPFRKRLARLVRKEMDRYRYERRRFYGYCRGWFWPGARKDESYWPDDPDAFAEEVSEDLSPRLRQIREIIERLQRQVDKETWEAFYRIRIMNDTYENLAAEFGVAKTVLRGRVYRVTKAIEKLTGNQSLAEIAGQVVTPTFSDPEPQTAEDCPWE